MRNGITTEGEKKNKTKKKPGLVGTFSPPIDCPWAHGAIFILAASLFNASRPDVLASKLGVEPERASLVVSHLSKRHRKIVENPDKFQSAVRTRRPERGALAIVKRRRREQKGSKKTKKRTYMKIHEKGLKNGEREMGLSYVGRLKSTMEA